jgi:hypothetical protein
VIDREAAMQVARFTAAWLLLCAAVTVSAAPLVVNKLSYQGDMPYVFSEHRRVAQRINTVV